MDTKKCLKRKLRPLRSIKSHLDFAEHINNWTMSASSAHNSSQGKKSKIELQGRQETTTYVLNKSKKYHFFV